MSSRRKFIIGSTAVLGGVAAGAHLSSCSAHDAPRAIGNTDPKTALVAWYSQTGHTARMGKLMAQTWRAAGLEVLASDIRKVDPQQAAQYDLLLLGAPVNFMDLPPNVLQWLDRLPDLGKSACASYVTYGNDGHNEHNTACHILEIAAERGAATVGMELFSNMNTFSPFYLTQSGLKRVLRYRNLPDEQQFERARNFAADVLQAVRAGRITPIEHKFDIAALGTMFAPVWWTKQAINLHRIDPETCIECGACQDKCPVGAIDLAARSIDHDKCIACMGCVNNCPTTALEMELFGRRVTGFKRMCEQQDIVIAEPEV